MKQVIGFFILITVCVGVEAQTCTSVGDGNWTSAATWSCDGAATVPDGTITDVIISAGDSVTITGFQTYNGLISVYGTLYFSGVSRLSMDASSGLNIYVGGNINGDIVSLGIRIGGGFNYVWSPLFTGGADGNVPGPTTIDNSGLPIDLISFAATSKNTLTILEWSTASEFNFDYFEIQRAIGSTDFKPIGIVSGAGEDVETIQEYSFVDEKPLNGINYYRLKAIDLDGTFEYSDIQAVKHNFDSRFDIYPNPSDGTSLNVLMDEVEEGYQIVIYDNLGLEVYDSPIKGHDEAYPLPNLKAGVYTIKLLGRGDNTVQKLVVH